MSGRSLSQSYLGLPAQYAKKEAVAERIKSLGRIIRRSNSVSASTTPSDFQSGPPSDSSQRRRRARDEEVHTDSFFDSPLYATASEGSQSSSPDPSCGIFDPLVKAGTMVATGELDRLSFLATVKAAANAKLSESGTTAADSLGSSNAADVPPNSPASIAASLSGATSPVLPLGSVLKPMTPIAPSYNPASALSSPGTAEPVAGTYSSKYSAQKKATQVSRLSEVHVADVDHTGENSGSDSGSVVATGASTALVDHDRLDSDTTPVSTGTEQGGSRADDEPISRLEPRSSTASPRSKGKRIQELRRNLKLPREDQPGKPKFKPLLKNINMDQLTELIDKAVVKAIAEQRITLTRSSTYPVKQAASAHGLDIETLRITVAKQLKLANDDGESPPASPKSAAAKSTVSSRSSSPILPRGVPGFHDPPVMATPVISNASTDRAERTQASRRRLKALSVPSKPDNDDLAGVEELDNTDYFTEDQQVYSRMAPTEARRQSRESTESCGTVRKKSVTETR